MTTATVQLPVLFDVSGTATVFGESATRQIASFLGSDPESVLKNLQIAQRNPRA